VTAARSRAQETPEFQDRYAETVIFRIFYHLDRSGLGRLTLRDLKRCGPRRRHPGAPARAAPARPIQRAVARHAWCSRRGQAEGGHGRIRNTVPRPVHAARTAVRA